MAKQNKKFDKEKKRNKELMKKEIPDNIKVVFGKYYLFSFIYILFLTVVFPFFLVSRINLVVSIVVLIILFIFYIYIVIDVIRKKKTYSSYIFVLLIILVILSFILSIMKLISFS